MNDFWKQIDSQLAAVRREKPDTAAGVIALLNRTAPDGYGPGSQAFGDLYSGAAFFAGSGGDDTLLGAMHTAGWVLENYRAAYDYTLRHSRTGSRLSYTEGDVDEVAS